MKMKYFVTLLFLAPSIALAGSQVAQIKSSLDMWQPKSVNLKGGVLSITSKERRVTDTIYKVMIESGLCLGILTNPNSLKGVRKIRVLNKFGRQGYIFEGGSSECTELINMPRNQTEIYIFSHTHMHINQ